MKSFRLGQWGSHILPLGSRCQCPLSQRTLRYSIRLLSSSRLSQSSNGAPAKRKRSRPRNAQLTPLASSAAAGALAREPEPAPELFPPSSETTPETPTEPTTAFEPQVNEPIPLEKLPSPHIDAGTTSPKLSSLHARISLPSRLPLQTLARTLIDKTADPDPRFNNESLAKLGNDLLGYYMAEHLVCQYPRLPIAVVFAAQQAYVGPNALNNLVKDWGVEAAAHPGGEVDPGLLQFRWTPPGTQLEEPGSGKNTRPDLSQGQPSKIVHDDQFGRPKPRVSSGDITPTNVKTNESEGLVPKNTTKDKIPTATLTDASADFMRALFAGIYLHSGAVTAYNFFSDHVISRHLDVSSLFTFKEPTRDLSRLCAREGFESPVARLISETGRLTRTPVFVVGIFSGRDKLGEGAGSSLNEARFKAALHALKGWYLYSPAVEQPVPSVMEGERGRGRTWKPALIDQGEVIV